MEIPPSITLKQVVMCKKCETEMDELEAGYLCSNCNLFIGYCKLCEIYSDGLIAWGLWNDKNSLYKFDEHEIKRRNKLSKYEFPEKLSFTFYAKEYSRRNDDVEAYELEDYDFFNPPYCKNDDPFEESTMWFFRCSKCNNVQGSYRE